MQKLNIILSPGQNLYLTSDMHFGHRNVIKFCNRPFADEKEMAKAMVKNWNDTVRPNDFIFSLGDFSWWTGRHEVKKLVEQLRGKKYFIPGNHCKEGMYSLVKDKDFHECSDVVHLYITGQDGDPRFAKHKVYELVLCHYPLTTWSHADHPNCFHFFGHIHSRGGEPLYEFGQPLALRWGKVMDAGCDRHGYAPVNVFDLIQEAEDYPAEYIE